MPTRDIIVVGTSAGGVQALQRLVHQFPPNFPAAVLVVLHIAPDLPSKLPEILCRAGPVPVHHCRDRDQLGAGRILVAPPGFHMLLDGEQVRLTHGPRENSSRPSIDVLFRSAARSYGPRVIAILLTGALYDGVAGLLDVRRAGGVAVVQAPADAAEPSLPEQAIKIAGADAIVPIDEMGALLVRLVRETVPKKGG
jgi:two-component system, chemotaxis family, protein-glutamate methylesterase/glutaminase